MRVEGVHFAAEGAELAERDVAAAAVGCGFCTGRCVVGRESIGAFGRQGRLEDVGCVVEVATREVSAWYKSEDLFISIAIGM